MLDNDFDMYSRRMTKKPVGNIVVVEKPANQKEEFVNPNQEEEDDVADDNL